jgi:HD-GYP domain-containing protein (c-di-GMP phosphodiesterase class II)
MSIPQREAQWIDLAARLHDLGTIGIPDLILHKGADLTLTERQIMQAHPESAYDALCEVRDFREVAAIVLHHHERYDGSGYPHGLEGKAIPLGSRIIAVLDAFDAMTSERPHRRPRAEREACEELLIGKGGQFDADIVDAFLETLRFGVH